MEEVFYDIFQGLPRQGPGNPKYTKKAIDSLMNLSSHPNILDIGCGTGAQTIELAHHLGGTIFSIDNHEPYLNYLRKKADTLGYGDIIHTIRCEMSNLEFPPEYFDLIWSEGSIYILGFEYGLEYLNSFLKKGGYIAVSEISWLKKNQPAELMEFFKQEYADMKSIDQNVAIVKKAGFQLVDHFLFGAEAWWDDYYSPLEERLKSLRSKYAEDDQVLELIEYVQLEIELYRKYPDYYGYVFFIMQKPG